MILAFGQSILLPTDSQFLFYLLGRWCCLVTRSCPTLFWPTRLLYPWDSPGKNTGVGSHSLLQGSSWPRNGIHVSCISCTAGGIFFFLFLTAEPPGKPSGKVLHILNLFWGFEIQAFMAPEGLMDRQEEFSGRGEDESPMLFIFNINLLMDLAVSGLRCSIWGLHWIVWGLCASWCTLFSCGTQT